MLVSTRTHCLTPAQMRRIAPLALAILAACATQGALAQTPPPAGTGIFLSNGILGTANYVGNGSASYATGAGISIYNGGGMSFDGQPFFALTSAPLPIGLTTGTLSTIGSSGPGGGALAEVTATADLRGGVLRANVLGTTTGSFSPLGPASARGIAGAQMRDNLNFQVLGGGTSTVTVTAHLDGFFALHDPLYASASQAMSLDFGGGSFSEIGGEFISGSLNTYYGHNGASGYVPPSGWLSYSFSNETIAGFDFVGVLGVSDGQRAALNFNLSADCFGATCGFGNTGRIGLVLSDNVSFRSDSGIFLTAANPVAPVPEPETWALLAAGLGLLGNFARRRRRA